MINKKIRIHRGSFKMIKRANQKKKKGFSLIELIIVLAVMAIIALIAIPNFTAVKNNSKIKADVQSCEMISRSIQALVVDETISGTGDITISIATPNTAVAGEGLTVKTQAMLDGIVSELKTPQQSTKTGYKATIAANGTVTTVTTP